MQVEKIHKQRLKPFETLHYNRFQKPLFIAIMNGTVISKLSNRTYRSNGLQLFHCPKETELTITGIEQTELYLIHYHVLADTVLVINEPLIVNPEERLEIITLLEKLYESYFKTTVLDRFQVKILFYQFVYCFFKELVRNNNKESEVHLPTQVMNYIHEHYETELTLETLAAALNYSVPHISLLFKKQYGSSPIDYLIKMRIRRAKELLTKTSLSVKEIARAVGYHDSAYFSRIFKKHMKASPTAYRLNNLQKKEDNPLNYIKFSIVEGSNHRYIENDNRYQFIHEGDYFMSKKLKALMVTGLLFSMLIILGACSSESMNKDKKTAEKKETAPKTRIVETKKGKVEIPANPKRVAADQYMGHLLKLGIVPMGVRSFMLDEGWIDKADIPKDTLKEIEDLGDFPMNLEKLTYLEPDLIIGSIEENIEQYEKVGTTVFLPYWEGLSTVEPLDKFRNVSKIFGKEKEAEQWISEYKSNVEKAKGKIKGIVKDGETVSVVSFSEKDVYVLAAEGGNYGSSTIYQMLGLPATEKAKNMEEGFEAVSIEVLPEYIGDHVFVYNGDVKATEEAMKTNIWQGLKAVKNDNVYLYGNAYHDEFVMEDPFSLEQQLETITNLLLNKK